RRERNMEVQHALNVFAAHNQVIKRKMTDPNQAIPGSPWAGPPRHTMNNHKKYNQSGFEGCF
ncbi:MAG: hypothetical protein ABSB91_08135, partial [Sedimentisphaerales bacterium]